MGKDSGTNVWHHAEDYTNFQTNLAVASRKGEKAVLTCLRVCIKGVNRSSKRAKGFMIQKAADELAKHVRDPHSICIRITKTLDKEASPRHIRDCLPEAYKDLTKVNNAKMQRGSKRKAQLQNSAAISPQDFDRGQASLPKPPTNTSEQTDSHVPLPPLLVGNATSISGLTYLATPSPLPSIPLPFGYQVYSGERGPNPAITLDIHAGGISSGDNMSRSWQNLSGQTVVVIAACIPNTHAAKLGELESSISGYNIERQSGKCVNYIVATNLN